MAVESLKEIGLDESKWTFEKENNPRILDGFQLKNFHSKIYVPRENSEYSRGTFFLEGKEIYRAWGIKKDPHCSYHSYTDDGSPISIYEGCPSVTVEHVEGANAKIIIRESDFHKEYPVELVPQSFRFKIQGLTCLRCEEKVRELLTIDKNIISVSFSEERSLLILGAYSKPPIRTLQSLLSSTKYTVLESVIVHTEKSSKFRKFLPLGVLFVLVLLFTIVHFLYVDFSPHTFTQYFMAGYFLIFGGLKVLNWKKFVSSYSAYDALAGKSRMYGYTYPALEVVLGIFYYFAIALFYVNMFVFALMLEKAYSVHQKLKSCGEVQCACLGGFFNIPVTRVTFAEDLLMVGMALSMLFV